MEAVLAPGVAAAAKNAKPGHGSVGASVRGLIRNRSSAWSVAVGRVKWGRKSGEYNTRTRIFISEGARADDVLGQIASLLAH